MKILQINTSLNSGSTGRIAEQIGLKVLENDFESYIAYSRHGNTSTSSTYQINNKLDVYKHVLETRLFDNHGFCSKKATKKFTNYINKLKPDIIHLHNIHGYYLHVEILFNYVAEYKIPLIWTFHDCWPFTGHCAYFDRIDCEKWKVECYECPLKSYYPSSFFLDNSKKNFHRKKSHFTSIDNLTIVTPSNWLKQLVNESFFKNYSTKVIPNGIDLSIFKETNSNIMDKYGVRDKTILLGVASIWDSRKGLNDFIKLSLQLGSDYQIILVGLTKKQVPTLPSSIIGIERTENVEELASLYSAATIYLNPTYSDNFPTTNIEALACGTPVITYDTGGSPEAIDGSTGIVVEKGDIQGLEEAINVITSDNINFLPKECRKRAESLFNKEDRFNDYVNLYY